MFQKFGAEIQGIPEYMPDSEMCWDFIEKIFRTPKTVKIDPIPQYCVGFIYDIIMALNIPQNNRCTNGCIEKIHIVCLYYLESNKKRK